MNKITSVKFKGHESFVLRRGWIYKGLKAVAENVKGTEFDLTKKQDQTNFDLLLGESNKQTQDVFLSNDITVILGLGSNMCKSLRYYLRACGLTEERRCATGKKCTVLTEFGQFVLEHDPNLRFPETIALVHLKLALNAELATAWYLFFSEMDSNEISAKELVTTAHSFLYEQGLTQVSERSIEDDFSCLSSMYAGSVYNGSLNNINGKDDNSLSFDPENLLESPFVSLKLLRYGVASNIVVKVPLKAQLLSYYFWAGIFLQSFVGAKEIPLEELYIPVGSVGRALNLGRAEVLRIADELDRKGLVRTIRTSGLDVIQLPNNEVITKEHIETLLLKCYKQKSTREFSKHEY